MDFNEITEELRKYTGNPNYEFTDLLNSLIKGLEYELTKFKSYSGLRVMDIGKVITGLKGLNDHIAEETNKQPWHYDRTLEFPHFIDLPYVFSGKKSDEWSSSYYPVTQYIPLTSNRYSSIHANTDGTYRVIADYKTTFQFIGLLKSIVACYK